MVDLFIVVVSLVLLPFMLVGFAVVFLAIVVMLRELYFDLQMKREDRKYERDKESEVE